MSRRFIPPALEAFDSGVHPDTALALNQAREAGYVEGHAAGQAAGFAAGRAEGEAAARTAAEAELGRLRVLAAGKAATVAVLAAIDALAEQRAADRLALETATRSVLVTALETLFPLLRDVAAGAEIAALTNAALTERGSETLSLRAAPATLSAVLAEGLADPGSGRLTLVPDQNCPPGQAMLAWFGGGLTFDPADLLRRVTDLLAPFPPSEDNPSHE